MAAIKLMLISHHHEAINRECPRLYGNIQNEISHLYLLCDKKWYEFKLFLSLFCTPGDGVRVLEQAVRPFLVILEIISDMESFVVLTTH